MFVVYSCIKISRSPLRMIASFSVVMLGLCHCSQGNLTFLGTPHISGPSEALVKGIVEFKCTMPNHPKNESVLLQLLKLGNQTELLGESTSLGGEPGVFNLIIKPSHEGSLQCVARAQNNSDIEPTYSDTHDLKVVEPVSGAEVDVLSGPVEMFEGQKLELVCQISDGNRVSYKWLLDGQLISRSPLYVINRTTSADGGSYMCEATNRFNMTDYISRSSIVITVKDVVSAPDISFSVLKETPHNYFARVTCRLLRGTPPVHFSLYNRTELVANMTSDDRSVVFQVPLVLDQNMGDLQCQAHNGHLVTHSQWLPLEVVSVGGPVTLHYYYDVEENFAVVKLRLYCEVTKGSRPQFQWFLNKTLLQEQASSKQASFYRVFNLKPQQSMLQLSVGRSSAGTYHCEVSDSFDNSTAISSRRQYLDKKVLNHLPSSVVATVFGGFTAIILLVSVCCVLGVVNKRRTYGEKSLLAVEMVRMVAAYEGELDLFGYSEDAEVVGTAAEGEFYQVSEASADD